MKYRSSRKYAKAPDLEVSRTAGKVIKGLTGNPILPLPPVLPADLDAKKDNFDQLIIAANKGGTLATAQKNAARADVIYALDQDASYVDIKCGDDPAVIIGAGYEVASTNRAQQDVEAPQVLSVSNKTSGALKPRVKVSRNTKSIVGRIKLASGTEFGPNVTFQNSRKILFGGLTAGLVYVFELMAIGGKNGQSNWSDPGQGMAQ